uniref:Serine--glyoxylate aminotransferase (Fragments) n=1 Tax=Triticum aestivum TaxID=4565 RepID=SGAT_WHEAT|nr:RecName: Full=Serine--glyoxylate aminotransferase; Short=SGAT; AltName: Full=Alanine--glyoxylate aminotransferase; Short=AGT [Triticum aestivum]
HLFVPGPVNIPDQVLRTLLEDVKKLASRLRSDSQHTIKLLDAYRVFFDWKDYLKKVFRNVNTLLKDLGYPVKPLIPSR